MIGRNFIVNRRKFSEHNEKICLKISFRYREIVKNRKYFTQLWRQWQSSLKVKICL